MRFQERKDYIIQKITQDGFVSISNVAKNLDVSIETIRRDINKLDNEGIIKKVRGGAEPSKSFLRKDVPRSMRLYIREDEKNRVGQAAALLIRDNSIIGLDCGVSIQLMAKYISGVQNVTIVTNSLPIASIIEDKMFCKEITGRLIFIGGEIDIQNRFARGALATDTLAMYHFDQAFLSCSAISTQGVSCHNIEESVFAGHMMRQATQKILLSEKDKLNKNSLHKYCEMTDFDYIVLDEPSSLPIDIKKTLEKSSTEIIFASQSS